MMRAIWNIISSTASSDAAALRALPVFSGGGRARELTVVRRPRLRGLRLSVDPRDATVRLTLGQRAALRPAVDWATAKRPWIEAELARLPSPRPIVPDLKFHLGDGEVRLEWDPARARRVGLSGEVVTVGGPRDQLAARVLRFLRVYALEVLARESRELARANGIGVGKIGVGDPVSRWGSCASSGDIRYSWRLILAPTHVRQATVAHEVAHRIHMNHGAAFHALVAELHGQDPAPARRWLKAHGAALHWFGREG